MTVKRWFNQVQAPLCVLLWDGLHGIETSNPLFFFLSFFPRLSFELLL